MAFQAKFTVRRGKTALADVALAAGAAEAQSDTISVNIDATSMGKADCLILIDELRQKIHSLPWPPL